MGYLLVLHFFLLSLIARAPSTDAWGPQGHYMVCKIAEQYLTRRAAEAVTDLLPDSAGGHLASVCSWADEVRSQYRWASPLHFVNTPGVCNFDYSRDCHNAKGEPDMCVAGAINNYTAQLQDPSGGYDLTQALMFLAHFMGDIHQPLHCGFGADLGGNTIIVHWYGTRSNLHQVWDVNVIETAMHNFYNNDVNAMIESIKMNITDDWSDEVTDWETCSGKLLACPDKYASESIRAACNYAYKDVKQNSTLEDDYFLSRLPVVKKRIGQAGVRLGALLNRIFSKRSWPQYLKSEA